MSDNFPIVPIRDADIRLGQFIKLANLVETGGMAKELIAAGEVQVNGDIETRRGRHLRQGDTVTIHGIGAVVGSNSSSPDDADDDLGEYFDEATADDDFDPEKWRNM